MIMIKSGFALARTGSDSKCQFPDVIYVVRR